MKLNKHPKGDLDLKNVKVHRSKEGTIFEVAAALILILAWLIALIRYQSGKFDVDFLLPMIIFTIAAVALLVGAYFPQFIHSGLPLNNMRQLGLAVRMCRVMAVVFAASTLCLAFFQSDFRQHYYIIAIMLPIIVFNILIAKAK